MSEQIPSMFLHLCYECGHQRKVLPEVVILPLLDRLAWKRLQVDSDMLLTVTRTADELLNGLNIDDLKRA